MNVVVAFLIFAVLEAFLRKDWFETDSFSVCTPWLLANGFMAKKDANDEEAGYQISL